VKERMDAIGAEAIGNGPEQFVERIVSDMNRWSEVIRKANVKVQ
jgi:tripartite-type tricarboxylate transporter receptor subunit TctC